MATKRRTRRNAPRRRINRMNTRSNKELLYGHSLLHAWANKPSRTYWAKGQIRSEHVRLVKIMRKRGMNHKSPLKIKRG